MMIPNNPSGLSETSSAVLAAIVNLDEEQLRTVDDDGSYGTCDDIAGCDQEEEENQTDHQHQQSQETHERECISQDEEIDRVNRAEARCAPVPAVVAEPTLPNAPKMPQYSPDSQQQSKYNYGSRRARIKNAIFSKWKTNRLLPKKTEPESIDREDAHSFYAIEVGQSSINPPLSQNANTSYTTEKRNSSNQTIHTLTPTADLLGLESTTPPPKHPQFHSNQSQTPLPPTLSKELFHWYVNRSWKKKLTAFLVLLSSGMVLYDILFFHGTKSQEHVDQFLDWMRAHPVVGIYGYICVLALTSLIYIPPSPLIISSGFIFRSIHGRISGPIIALLASYVGAVIGGSIGFVRAKYMTRDLIQILMRRYPLLRAIDAAVVRNSLRVMILLRLNPLIPFGVLNYLFGISGVSLTSFVLGIVGVVPWHLWLVCVGASANSLIYDDENATMFRVILFGMGTAFGVIGMIITWRFAKKELQKEMNSQAINDFRIQDPNLTPQITPRRSDNEIEDADLEFVDYVRMQFLGMNIDDAIETSEGLSYRSKLDWELCILDDFS